MPRLRTYGGGLAILAAVFAVYWPALRGQFVWDDLLLVAKNPLVTGEFTLRSIWFQTDFPLSLAALWAQWLAFGKNPAGYHVVNVALHALNALLVWRLLGGLRIRGAWLGAALFALHPVCVGSVAWISEIKNTLSLAFFLVSFILYTRAEGVSGVARPAAEGGDHARADEPSAPGKVEGIAYGLSLLAFALALLSKTSTVVLPVLLLWCALWRRGRLRREDWLRVAPFLLLAFSFGLLSVWFQQYGAIGALAVKSEGLAARLAGAGCALWFYLGKALAPVNLNVIYPRWEVIASSPVAYAPLLLWICLLGGLAFLCVRGVAGAAPVASSQSTPGSASLLTRCRALWFGRPAICPGQPGPRHALFAFGAFTIALFPVLGFFDMYYFVISRVADHFQYLPIIAITALAGAALGGPYDSGGVWRRRGLCLSVAVALLAACAVLAFQRARVFSTESGLWTDALSKNPASWSAHNNMACILAERQDFAGARGHFEASLRLNPRNADAQANYGRLLAMEGSLPEAAAHLALALKLKPQAVPARRTYASVLARQGKTREAIGHLREALRLEPGTPARLDLSALLKQSGDTRGAIAVLRQAVAADPASVQALNNLAWMLATAADATLRDGTEAVRLAGEACRLTDQRDPMTLGTLAAAYAEAGRFPEAISTAEKLDAIATAAGDARTVALNRQLLKFYRAGKAYHDTR